MSGVHFYGQRVRLFQSSSHYTDAGKPGRDLRFTESEQTQSLQFYRVFSSACVVAVISCCVAVVGSVSVTSADDDTGVS